MKKRKLYEVRVPTKEGTGTTVGKEARRRAVTAIRGKGVRPGHVKFEAFQGDERRLLEMQVRWTLSIGRKVINNGDR